MSAKQSTVARAESPFDASVAIGSLLSPASDTARPGACAVWVWVGETASSYCEWNRTAGQYLPAKR